MKIHLFLASLCLLAGLGWAKDQANSEIHKDKIDFPAAPKGKEFKVSIDDNQGVLMSGWYSAVKTFVKVVQPNKPPVDKFFNYFTEDNFNFKDSLIEILELEKGFVACAIFGLLFIILVPLVGLFFCLCRSCGNCGGKMVQAQKDNLNCRRKTYLLLLFLTFCLMGVAVVNMYACNEVLSNSIPKSHSTINDNLDDASTFINNTYDEVKYVIEDSYDLTENMIIIKLDYINETLGVPIYNALKDEFQTDDLFDHAKEFATATKPTLENFATMMSDSKKLVMNLTKTLQDKIIPDLANQLTDWKGSFCSLNIPAFTDLCNKVPIKLVTDINQISNFQADLESHYDIVKNVLDEGIMDHIITAENEFHSVPYHVSENTIQIRKDIKVILEDIKTKIRKSKEMKNLENIKTEVLDATHDAKEKVDDIMQKMEDFAEYRWWAGLTVCLIISLCVGLLLLGMCCGVVGYKAGALPTQRSIVSDAGGVSLMAAVGFMFIFSSLLMIIATAFFLVGAHGEAFICDPMYNDLPILDKIKDATTKNMQHNDFVAEMKISNILRNCEKNEPAYEALDLKSRLNVSNIKDLVNRKAIYDKIDAIEIDLSLIDVIPNDLKELLNNYTNGVEINFNDIKKELKGTIVNLDVMDYAKELQSTLDEVIVDTVPVNLQNEVKNGKQSMEKYIEALKKELPAIIKTVEMGRKNLLNFVESNEKELDELHFELTNITERLTKLHDDLLNNLVDFVKKPILDYSNLLLSLADQYIEHIGVQLEENLAKCKPIWNVYNSARYVLCKLLLDPFNGFWFALGWCLAFFIPAIIFGVKLARHFRKMKYTEFEGVGKDDKDSQVDSDWRFSKNAEKKELNKDWSLDVELTHAYHTNTSFKDDYDNVRRHHRTSMNQKM